MKESNLRIKIFSFQHLWSPHWNFVRLSFNRMKCV